MSESAYAPMQALAGAWSGDRASLDSWVRSVCEAFDEADVGAVEAADVLGVTLAELEAVIRLGTLDDDALALVSTAQPPMTTWLLLSQLPLEEMSEALSGLAEHKYSTAFESVQVVIRDLNGTNPAEKVTTLESRLFEFAALKADRYAVWSGNNKNIKALKGFASRRRSGSPLTPKQAMYALNMLKELVAARSIQVPSPDGDDEQCQAIIEAIG